MSLLVICEITFVNTLTVDDKYFLCNSENLQQAIQMGLSKKRKYFSNIFAAFLKYASSSKYFEKKMTLIASAFPKLATANDFVRPIS